MVSRLWGQGALLAGLLVIAAWWTAAVTMAATLPLASTVEVVDAAPGSVVIFNEASEQYVLSGTADSAEVFGVVALRPAIVLETSSTSPLVTTQGVTPLLVDVSGGPIVRGDILTTASSTGTARKATLEDHYPFAVALEPFSDNTPGVIQVEVNPVKAREVAAARRDMTNNAADQGSAPWTRIVLAALVVIAGVGFLLWSFRAMFVSSITSIGRNPRAKQAVLLTTIGGAVLGVVLIIVVVFIALGILVLPTV